MSVWPTDGADGSVSSEARWRKMGRIWAPSAVVAGAGGELAPSLSMPNLTVQSGAAWVDGHYTELASNQVLTATANGIAVVRFDPAANTAELLWRDGVSTPAQSPTGTWELLIAQTTGSVLSDKRMLHPGDIAYGELTSVKSVTATSPTDIVVSVPATNFDGRRVLLEFFAPAASTPSATGAQLACHLFDGGTDLGMISQLSNPAAGLYLAPLIGRRRLSPTPGVHSYSIRAAVYPGGSASIAGGVGGPGVYHPAFLRITRD